MIRDQQHQLLVGFLREVKDNTSAFSFISSRKAKKLLSLMITVGTDCKRQNEIADAIDERPDSLRRKFQYPLNEALRVFSESCEISPPVQLYFSSTQGGYECGGHFACCRLDPNTPKSDHLVNLETLRKMIGKARKLLNLKTPDNENNTHLPIGREYSQESPIKTFAYFRGKVYLSNDTSETNAELLQIYSVGRNKYRSDWKDSLDKLHDDWLCLIWATRGQLIGQFNKNSCSLSPGQIAIVFPNSELSELSVNGNSTAWWCCFDGPTVQRTIETSRLKEGVFLSDIDPAQIFHSWVETLNRYADENLNMGRLIREYSARGTQLLQHIGDSIASQDSLLRAPDSS